MKQFIRTLLLSLLLTGVIGAAFWLFQQGTFFDPVVNRITMVCLVLLLAIVWYLFFSNLWFYHMQRKQRVPDALPQPEPEPETKPEPDEPAPEPEPEEPEPEAAPEPEPANGPEATVFIPPQPEPEAQTAAPESAKADPEPQGWAAAPESAERPAQKSTRAVSARKTAEEKAAEKARKLQQAAQEKQARRARKLEEDAARQQKKLEELLAEAARKKSAAPKKRVDWKNGEQ